MHPISLFITVTCAIVTGTVIGNQVNTIISQRYKNKYYDSLLEELIGLKAAMETGVTIGDMNARSISVFQKKILAEHAGLEVTAPLRKTLLKLAVTSDLNNKMIKFCTGNYLSTDCKKIIKPDAVILDIDLEKSVDMGDVRSSAMTSVSLDLDLAINDLSNTIGLGPKLQK